MFKEVDVILPKEYSKCACFEGGVFILENSKLFRYLMLIDKTETYNVESIIRKRETVFEILTDARGEYVVFNWKKEQILFSRHTEESFPISHTGAPKYSCIDKGKLVNLFEDGVSTHSIPSIIKNLPSVNTFLFKQNDLMQNNSKIMSNGACTIVSGDILLEVDCKDILSDRAEETSLFQLEISQVNTSVKINRCVLLKPEPITFLRERVKDVCFTAWGLVLAYETGVEVYRSEAGNYSLSYIYKRAVEIVKGRKSILPEKRVFVRDSSSIIELLMDAPLFVCKMSTSTILYCADGILEAALQRVFLLSERSPTPVLEELEGMPEEEAKMHRSFIDSLSQVEEYLSKYKKIDYNSVLEGREEEEQKLILEKIFNSYKKDISSRCFALFLSLNSKLAYLKRCLDEVQLLKEEVDRKKERVSKKSVSLVDRLDTSHNKAKKIREAAAKAEKGSPEVQEVRKAVENLKNTLELSSLKLKEHAQQQGQLSLLKQQNAFLKKRIAELKRFN